MHRRRMSRDEDKVATEAQALLKEMPQMQSEVVVKRTAGGCISPIKLRVRSRSARRVQDQTAEIHEIANTARGHGGSRKTSQHRKEYCTRVHTRTEAQRPPTPTATRRAQSIPTSWPATPGCKRPPGWRALLRSHNPAVVVYVASCRAAITPCACRVQPRRSPPAPSTISQHTSCTPCSWGWPRIWRSP